MSGIEKICEFSGEYPGADMYQYKKNSIQIIPSYRNKFKNAEHVLHIFKPVKIWKGKGKQSFTQDYNLDEMTDWSIPFTNIKKWEKFHSSRYNCRAVNEYNYCLQVFDDKLKGEVDGIYLNWSTDISAVKRKIKRILKSRKLNVKYHNVDYQEWKSIND